MDNEKWNRWIIVARDTKEVIGTCLVFWNEEDGHFDISYNLGKKYWGNGYATEAMARAMRYGTKVVGIKKYRTSCVRENKASHEKQEEKLGDSKTHPLFFHDRRCSLNYPEYHKAFSPGSHMGQL